MQLSTIASGVFGPDNRDHYERWWNRYVWIIGPPVGIPFSSISVNPTSKPLSKPSDLVNKRK